jgi:hypothetical protein
MNPKRQVLISTAVILILVAILSIKLGFGRKTIGVDFYFPPSIKRFCFNDLCLAEDEIWWLETAGQRIPANEEKVERYLEVLRQIKLDRLISENPERFEELGVGQSWPVEILAGEKKLQLGEMGIVRQDNGVYKIDGSIDKSQILNVDYWRKNLITNLPFYQIKKISVRRLDKEIVIEPKDGKWKNQEWVEKAVHLNIGPYLPDGVKDKPYLSLKIETEEKTTEVNLGRYWATIGNKYYFEINRADYSLLTKGYY